VIFSQLLKKPPTRVMRGSFLILKIGPSSLQSMTSGSASLRSERGMAMIDHRRWYCFSAIRGCYQQFQ
ncbi:hypothetical protein, partial [Desulfobacter sp. UBA2225]|uniref:hypothetical protein n=1 Tax=Desulfobacter sp. UBA2225 TaxID=1961413 RepID=UPI00257FA9FA